MTASVRRSSLVAGLAVLGLAGCSNTEGPVSASTTKGAERESLVQSSRAALEQLYATRPGTRQLAETARAILVFPNVTEGDVGIGGLYGNGTMFEGGREVGFYNIAGGTFGFQLGAQSFSHGIFFNTAEALETFRRFKGFQAGVGATAVAADFGADGALTTATLQKPVVAVTWGQSGLMAGVNLEGAKITEINPQ